MLDQVRVWMEKQPVDGMFVQKKENVRYLSRYTGDDSFLLITRQGQFFLTDPRYTEQAQQECPDFEIVVWRQPGKTLGDAVARLCSAHSLKTLAFEDDAMVYGRWADFKEKAGAELVPAGGVVEELRAVKTPEEIACLRTACDISCRAFERILKDIRVGATEKELAAKLSGYMVYEGADTQPYGNILISGARTSLLHGIPSAKAVEYGDFVLMDFGCQYKGYLSDMTRTVVVGKASPRQREVYGLEKQMIEASEAVMRAGTALKDVYQASVAPILDMEYYQYHYRGLGHGIGLFVHELPFINPESEAVYQAGNVTTIEPGLYIPGWGGVRIEDQLLITESGNENMVSTTHELIEL